MDTIKAHIPIFDLYGLWYTPFWRTWWFLTIVILVFLFLIGLIVYGIYRWYRIKKQKQYTPSQRAIAQLSALSVQGYGEKGSYDLFYLHLTTIIKHYITERYGINVSSKTDEELLHIVKAMSVDPSVVELLESLIDGALYIKFAKQRSVYEHMRSDINRSIHLITVLEQKLNVPHEGA